MATDNTQVFIKDSKYQTWAFMPALRPDRRGAENGPWAEHVGGAPRQPDGVLAVKYYKNMTKDTHN